MHEHRPLSEVTPECRLIVDGLPPLGKRVWLISRHGAGFVGQYHPEYEVVAWSPLPKLQPNQKTRMAELTKAGVNLALPLDHQLSNAYTGATDSLSCAQKSTLPQP